VQEDGAAAGAAGASASATSEGAAPALAGRRSDSADLDAAEFGAAARSPSPGGGRHGPGPDPLVGLASYGTLDCVVCMEGLTFPLRASAYMVTPCDHIFHTQCLRPWLDQALQCPTCRLTLPEPGR
jgi:hypothetical protein